MAFILQELQEKEHKFSSRKEILKTLRIFQKIGKDGWPRRLCHIEIMERADRAEGDRARAED